MTSSNPDLKQRPAKRVRPLLGTFVEITLRGRAAGGGIVSAFAAAFDAIGDIDRLMSYHRPESDLSRLNRAAAGHWLRVNPHTARVLALSNDLFLASSGAFDVRCGAVLAGWGLLPAAPRAGAGRIYAAMPAPLEIQGRRVRKTGPWTLDLGGIAKGYAVDHAVNVLRARGITSGLVNAGGDLRAFGPHVWRVSVRHPARPALALAPVRLQRAAMATSGSYFSRRRVRNRWVSALVRMKDRTPFLKKHSVSVLSDNCAMADALSKVATLEPARANVLLAKFNAMAFSVDVRGAVRLLN